MQPLTTPALSNIRRRINRRYLLTAFLALICYAVNTSFTNKAINTSSPAFMPVITITASDPSTGELTLSDHGNTVASRSQKVTWVVSPNSGVKAIIGITVKEGSTNVFDPLPKQLGNSANWRGTISPTIEVPAEELYNIIWIDGEDNEHVYDPKIQVKS